MLFAIASLLVFSGCAATPKSSSSPPLTSPAESSGASEVASDEDPAASPLPFPAAENSDVRGVAPAEEPAKPEKIVVADAALYRGTIVALVETEGGKLVTLEQAAGTDFGAPSRTFLIDDATSASFEADRLVQGAYLGVYYGRAPGQALGPDEAQRAIGANLYPEAGLVVFNGTIQEIQPAEGVENEGSLVMEELDTGSPVVFHFGGGTTQFYLNEHDLKPGDRLNILHRGAYTRSIPPQGFALEVRPYVEPAQS